MNINMNSEFL